MIDFQMAIRVIFREIIMSRNYQCKKNFNITPEKLLRNSKIKIFVVIK